MKITNSKRVRALSLGLLIAGASTAQAQVAEDNSAAFKADADALGAALGLPAAESTVTTDNNGMTSATVGLRGLKALVVRENADGSVSYGHVSTEAEASAFLSGQSATGPKEQ